MAVAVVVNPGASGAPADALVMQACLPGDIGERAVAIVVPQNVMAPIGEEQVVPAIVVIITDTYAHAPAGALQAGLLGNVCKSAVAVVLVEMAGGLLSTRPGRLETRSV